jgi:glucokinase
MSAFLQKGRMAGLLADVPVAVVTESLVGVRGALAIAREFAAGRRSR